MLKTVQLGMVSLQACSQLAGSQTDSLRLFLSQDIEAGDGTTSVVVIAGALLGAAERLFGPELKWTDRGATSSEQSETTEAQEGNSSPDDHRGADSCLQFASVVSA